MIARLVKMVLHTVDRLEVRGRRLRSTLAELVIAGTMLSVGGALALLSCLTLAGALALVLWPHMPPPVTFGFVGVLIALASLLTTALGWRLANSGK